LLVLGLTKISQASRQRKVFYSGIFAIFTLLAIAVLILAFSFRRLY
jgi:uncharacterized membrane protein